jgi:hypothetical protein
MVLLLRLLGRLLLPLALISNPSLHLERGPSQRVMQQARAFSSKFGVAAVVAQKMPAITMLVVAVAAAVIPKSG